MGAAGKRFEIKKWNAVAMWSWAICTDTCGRGHAALQKAQMRIVWLKLFPCALLPAAICRNNLYEPSIEYQDVSTVLFKVFVVKPVKMVELVHGARRLNNVSLVP
eukprot:1139922-Pelagomonas_calceolata.AAC.1